MLKNIKYLAVLTALFLSACSHQNVVSVQPTDNRLSCTDIAAELAEVRGVLRSIDDKTGMSGRNIAMGIFFWPGVVVNQMNAGDARDAANARLAVLGGLKDKQNCK
jgi:hypothetical protein|tara:strand:+ start:173 stop:490 length:318 start_codon:yes stop_codon:yes gene_type:complete